MGRERGENGIKQLEGGRWQVRVTFTDSKGKRRVFKRQAETISEAKRLKKGFLSELERVGENVLSGERLTFGQLSKAYQERKLVPAVYVGGRRVAGVKSLAPALSGINALNAHFSRKLIKSINSSDIEDFKILRLSTPTKNDVTRAKENNEPVVCTRTIAAVNRELELLRSIFNFAKRHGWIYRSPFELGAKLISKVDENRRERILTHEEECRLLDALDHPRRRHLKPLVITALDTAARRGELFKLRWSDVDFANGLIRIRATNTKTQTERLVGMTSRAERALNGLFELAPDQVDGLVFGITRDVKTGFRSALEEAGIHDFRFHDIRHTAISRMVNEGLPAAEVMKSSGHTQYATFQRYVNPTISIVRENARRLEQYNEVRLQELRRSESDAVN
jgi:integrase